MNIETYLEKNKTKRENIEETDIKICLEKKNKEGVNIIIDEIDLVVYTARDKYLMTHD